MAGRLIAEPLLSAKSIAATTADGRLCARNLHQRRQDHLDAIDCLHWEARVAQPAQQQPGLDAAAQVDGDSAQPLQQVGLALALCVQPVVLPRFPAGSGPPAPG